MRRYTVIDILRGAAVISMVAYHTLWDLVYIFDVKLPWFKTQTAHFWQLSIRWIFILLSGFCFFMSKDKLKHSLIILACSLLITAATAIFMPQNYILFGVLSLIGAASLLTIPLEKLFRKISGSVGFIACLILFILTQNAELGFIKLGSLFVVRIPDFFYANLFTAFLGFPSSSFHSPDYVPLIPWIFSFWMGCFLYLFFERKNMLKYLFRISFKPLELLGKNSLIIYMLHQPVVYGIIYLIFILYNQ